MHRHTQRYELGTHWQVVGVANAAFSCSSVPLGGLGGPPQDTGGQGTRWSPPSRVADTKQDWRYHICYGRWMCRMVPVLWTCPSS